MTIPDKINWPSLLAICKAIGAADNAEILGNHLIQLIVAAFEIQGAAILIKNPGTGEMEILASCGMSSRFLNKGPILADRSLKAALEGEPVLVPDITGSDQLQYPEECRREGIKAIAVFPMFFSGRVLGVLRLYHHEVWELSEHDTHLLFLLAETIGLAICHTRLVDAVGTINEVIQNLGADQLD